MYKLRFTMYDLRFTLKSLLIASLIFFPFFSKAQLVFGIGSGMRTPYSLFPSDTLSKDTLPKLKIHSPKKAVILSVCLPGLGQAYNKKWWKIPVIYAGFGGLTYGFLWNQKYYHDYHMILVYRYDNDPATIDPYPNTSDDDLVTLKNYYRRYRDLCVIGAAALYTLQVIDAAVDAHLWYFNEAINDDLSVRFSPCFDPDVHSASFGVKMSLHFN